MSPSRFLEEELSTLKEKIRKMGTLVEEQITAAMKAYATGDVVLAQTTIENDHLVNAMDVDVDETCIRLLALYQPMARDLRFITTAMKIATDLERMSDLSEDICERAIELSREGSLAQYVDKITQMAKMSQSMVREALEAFVRADATLARKVCTDDQQVDNIMQELFSDLLRYMMNAPAETPRAIRVSFIAKYIERIADHATNVAEVVVYLIEGKIIRHTVVN